MSYDVGLYMDTGGVSEVAIGQGHNITYNLAPIFALAFDDPDGLKVIDELYGRAAWNMLYVALGHITNPDNIGEYRELNPSNGWGDHDGAIRFLFELMDECRRHPRATVRVS